MWTPSIHYMHWWAMRVCSPTRHLDRFIRFCRLAAVQILCFTMFLSAQDIPVKSVPSSEVISWSVLDPITFTGFLRPRRVWPQQHLDRLSGFCRRMVVTSTRANHATTSVAIACIYVTHAMRPKTNKLAAQKKRPWGALQLVFSWMLL